MSDKGNSLANIKVNKKPIKDLDSEVVTVREIISASGRDPDEVDVFQLENQGGRRRRQSRTVHGVRPNREAHENALPSGSSAKCRLLSSPEAPTRRRVSSGGRIRRELEREGNNVYALFHEFQLPEEKYNKETVTILQPVPIPYPDGEMEMFWTDEDIPNLKWRDS